MEHRQQLESLGCGVVVVGQNKDVPQAEEWNTSGSFYCDFIHFCDPDKVFYKAYGFDRSLAGVWGPVSLDFYVKEQQSGASLHTAKPAVALRRSEGRPNAEGALLAWLSGRELHPSKGQDVNQMGGDILIDGDGTVTLPYYSKTNTDRPTLEAIIETLKSARHKRR